MEIKKLHDSDDNYLDIHRAGRFRAESVYPNSGHVAAAVATCHPIFRLPAANTNDLYKVDPTVKTNFA